MSVEQFFKKKISTFYFTLFYSPFLFSFFFLEKIVQYTGLAASYTNSVSSLKSLLAELIKKSR